MAPAMLERAVASGAAPTLKALMDRGRYVPDCVAAFPSVTPGLRRLDRHRRRPGRSSCSRDELVRPRASDRYVEYGSSFRAAQRFGIAQQLTDTVYNLNRAHLSAATPTVFETLDDAERAHRRDDLSDVPRPPPATSPSATPP